VRFWKDEAEVADRAMAYLSGLGWDCYPEAAFGRGNRADIAATWNGQLWIVECKLSASLSVLDQAIRWVGQAHRVSVCCPGIPSVGAFMDVLRLHGIGGIAPSSRADEPCFAKPPARLNRAAHRFAQRLIGKLHPDMKNYTPGTKAGFSSPWRRTMDAAILEVKRSGGCTIRHLVDSIQHHYLTPETARNSLLTWLTADPRVVVDRSVRPAIVRAILEGR
jgi:hypothetical protein